MKTGTTTTVERRFAIGAEVHPGGVHFRVWAPRRRTVANVAQRVGAGCVAMRCLATSMRRATHTPA